MQVQATEASAAAARQAIDEVRKMYASAEEILAPFMDLVPQQIQELGRVSARWRRGCTRLGNQSRVLLALPSKLRRLSQD